jgi:hypothetical protein
MVSTTDKAVKPRDTRKRIGCQFRVIRVRGLAVLTTDAVAVLTTDAVLTVILTLQTTDTSILELQQHPVRPNAASTRSS